MFWVLLRRIFLYPLDEIKKKSKIAATTAVASVLIIMIIVGYAFLPYTEHLFGGISGQFTLRERALTYGISFFSGDVNEIDVVTGNVTQYSLPLNPAEIENYQDLLELNLPESVIDRLLENGFVVTFLNMPEEFLISFADYYENLPPEFPRFVTADMVLHTFHSLFAALLMNCETEYFIPWLNITFKELLRKAIQLYLNDPMTSEIVSEAIIRLIAYLIVPLKLLDPNYNLPSNTPSVAVAMASEELEKIYNHVGIEESAILEHREDYTQYVPRGYYTVNESLSRYFLAAMYLGRMYFPVVMPLNETFADVATIAAFLLTNLVYNTKNILTHTGELSAFEIYERIYHITAFFVGYSDDLTFYDYKFVLDTIYGQNVSLNDFADDDKLQVAQSKLIELDHSRISAVGYRYSIEEVGLRFLGQRFILDSYVFQKLVYPEVFDRYMPTALDIAAAFGSERAREHLSPELNSIPQYKEKLENVSAELKTLNVTAWTWNLYNGWLYTINATLKENYTGYPTFMQTDAWKDEKLSTFFGSWTELRHDTILYAKQSYTRLTAIIPESRRGYVEPLPLLWSRLKGLVLQMKNGLKALGVLPEEYEEKLNSFYEKLDFLLAVSIKELKNIPLNETENAMIYYFHNWLSDIMLGIHIVHQKTTLIADVHTDPNNELILEEGVGYIHLLIVVYPKPDGTLEIAMGPVFSYYEFTRSMSLGRLTDEAWADMLRSGEAPSYPSWTSSYLVPP